MLLGSAASVATGNGHLFTAETTQTGVQLGGVLGAAIPVLLSLWEAIPDKFKPSK
ncbi:hypothetical protein AB6E04_08200 [Vibrio amylolyticus]|uniref:hypothetical protein n=1 Tax=Vibrio amylolyticus TaxID=2847292 RepID=UPI0035524B20